MIARLRGEQHERWARWRPTPAGPVSFAEEPVEIYDDDEVVDDPAAPAPSARGRSTCGRLARLVVVCFLGLRLARALMRWALVLVLLSLFYVAIRWVVREYTPQPAALPASPRAWLNAYEAASIDNPPEVCSQLLSSQLAASYSRMAHESCGRYFGRMTSSSVTVRRVLKQGSTAVLELRQTLNHRNWSVVLDQRNGGWQAVDLLGY